MYKYHQKGALGAGAMGLLVVLAVVLLLAGTVAMSYISAHNYGNEAEKALTAKHNDVKNVHANYTLKIAEMAQVPAMYRNDLLKVVTETFEGRYGEGGSKATWQWLQEQNPNLDPALYNRLQQTMEAGRNDFQVAQTELIDKKRAYETSLGYLWKGFWLKLAGYPKINLDEIKVVLASGTEEVFVKGVDEGIKLQVE